MDQMELVESLREKTGCSYSEAKAALDETDGDLLEALCWLENHGKAQMTGASCSTEDRQPPEPEEDPAQERKWADGPFVRGCRSLWQGLAEVFRWGNRSLLIMKGKKGQQELAVPLTILVLLLIVAFWLTLALIVLAMFCGCRFSLEGPAANDNLNDAMDRATDFAETIKDRAFSKDDGGKEE